MIEAAPRELATRRFTVEEVLRMVEVGILREDEPYELIGGRLVVVPPQGPAHSSTTSQIADRLRPAYSERGVIREEKPLVAGVDSLPEPDIAVVRGGHDAYRTRHPSGADALLVVETAVTSHATDHEKAAEYARAGVPVYWLVDVPARRVEVHSEPQPDGRYRVVRILAGQDELPLPETPLRWRAGSLFD